MFRLHPVLAWRASVEISLSTANLWQRMLRWLMRIVTTGKWSNAEKEFQQTLQLDPTYANRHHWYGLYLSWGGRHAEALSHLKRAVELDPTNLKYNDNLAAVYQNAGEYDRALQQFNKTVAMYPESSIIYNDLGDLYRTMGNYGLWLESWKKQATLTNNHYIRKGAIPRGIDVEMR